MNKNIIGLDKPASWRNVREKPGGCALFKRGIDIYFFILALKYVSFFFFFRGGFTYYALHTGTAPPRWGSFPNRWLFSRTIM